MNKTALKKRRRRRLAFILLLAFIGWMIWGNQTIEISHYQIKDAQIPASFNGFQIAQVSDLHNKSWGDRLVHPLHAEKPDAIVLTGDLIDARTPDLETALEFVDSIKDLAPIYFILGNQETWSDDYPDLEEGLLKLGVTILDSKSIILNQGEDEILLLGVYDPSIYNEVIFDRGHFELMELEIQELIKDFEGYKILLSHRAEGFDIYTRNEVDLVFAGHAHGGQVRLPLIGGLYAPGQWFFPEYTDGIYEENDVSMVVSRGLGNSVIPIRFNNRPELVFVELQTE